MGKLKLRHGSHECVLTSPEIVSNQICNICFKDEPVEFACNPCNFDLCKPCSELPQKLSHHLHPEHALEFSLGEDRKTKHMVCFGCGNMSSGSFYYECKKCDEVYLDLDCALQKSSVTGWEAKEMLHYSHEHLLRRCRPGRENVGYCLLCELPFSPFSICYGCVHCQLFFHERCLGLPTEFQHPVHPAHPLRRLDFIQTLVGKKSCNACKRGFRAAPFGCLECAFYLHLRCADSLLRGLMHKSHEHRLVFIVDSSTYTTGGEEMPCQICMKTVMFHKSYYLCVECDLKFHITCLEIPESVVNKSYHIHQLGLIFFQAEEKDSLEFCGVCETFVCSGEPAYSCQECDYLGHVGWILREEVPSPLYLKDLYSCGEGSTKSTYQEDQKTDELEEKLIVNGINHIHVMRLVHMSELDDKSPYCNICSGKIRDSPFTCETCRFQSHQFCVELGGLSRHQFHLHHSLTLLPNYPERRCESCKNLIEGFNLFCRICNFIIHVKCALKGKKMLGALHMGQKITGTWVGLCIQNTHSLFQVIVSRSYSIACDICNEKLCGKALSCVACGDICHPLCIQAGRQGLVGHPLHSDHRLEFSRRTVSKCITCQLDIAKYGYHCFICKISFHIECIKAVRLYGKISSHSHYFYNFWIDDPSVTRACSVCARPCGKSFYGCIDCNFSAHVRCIGFPSNVKNQRHRHTLTQIRSSRDQYCSLIKPKKEKYCSLCESKIFFSPIYSCYHCKDAFDIKCVMSTDDREAATEDEQLQDIYLMYLERDLFNLLKDGEDVIEDSDSS